MRLLIVDDDAGLRQSLGLLLAESGYDVVSEGDPEDGLARATSEPFDLILCDVRMPKMDGLTFLRRYRAERGSALLIMMMRRPAERFGLVDHPGGRKRHAGVVPLTGGVAIPAPEMLNLPKWLGASLSANLGQQWIDQESKFGTRDYLTWDVGGTLSLFGLDVDLRYTDTDLSRKGCFGGGSTFGDLCEARFVATMWHSQMPGRRAEPPDCAGVRLFVRICCFLPKQISSQSAP